MEPYEFDTYCGLSCHDCEYKETMNCGGCIATKGKPFHGHCDVAACAIERGRRFCGECENILTCDTLKRYSYDEEHGDNGQRIENCNKIKAALVARARVGLDPIAYCGFCCENCMYDKWCGGCRSDYNCCSYATICEGGLCPNAVCCEEKGIDGCWECPDIVDCEKGFYSNKNEHFCKATALFIRKHGKKAYMGALKKAYEAGLTDTKPYEEKGSVEGALELLEKYL